MNEISGRKRPRQGKIRTKNLEECVRIWKEHFSNLLGKPPVIDKEPVRKVFDTLPIDVEEFTMEEFNVATKSAQNNKTSGLNTIPAEVWKYGGLKEELLAICQKAYHSDVPDIWRKGGILPLPKKGDLGLTTNYRGITLSAVAAKIYNRMLNQLRPHIDPKLRIHQNDFQRNRSTVAQILVLRKLLEGIKAKNLSAVMKFIDSKKALDSIQG